MTGAELVVLTGEKRSDYTLYYIIGGIALIYLIYTVTR